MPSRRARRFIQCFLSISDYTSIIQVFFVSEREQYKAMKGHPGLLRLNVSEYHIICRADNGELTVYVLDAGNRGQIYRKY